MDFDLDHLSPSQVNTYLRCEVQYENSYIKHLKRPPAGIMLLGSTYHEGTEFMLRSKMDGDDVSIDDTLDVYNDAWNHNIEKEADGVDWSEDNPSVLKDAGVDLTRLYYNHLLPDMNPIMVEAGCTIQTDTVPLRMFIDQVRMDDEDYVLSDHKISKKRSDQSKHFVQLTLYTVGLKEDYGIETGRTEIQLAVAGKKTKDITIEPLELVTDRDREFVMNLVNTVAKKIQTGLFAPTGLGTWACSEKWCGYWDICRGRK